MPAGQVMVINHDDGGLGLIEQGVDKRHAYGARTNHQVVCFVLLHQGVSLSDETGALQPTDRKGFRARPESGLTQFHRIVFLCTSHLAGSDAMATIPILRIFDEDKAREFYLDYLGFEIDFEHRHEDGMPLYMGVSKGECTLHLSEHYGDATPGSSVRIDHGELDIYLKELDDKQYKYYRPSIEKMPWGTRDMTILDPFGNRLIFTSA